MMVFSVMLSMLRSFMGGILTFEGSMAGGLVGWSVGGGR